LQDLKVSETQQYNGGPQVNSLHKDVAQTNGTQLMRVTNAADVSNDMQTVKTNAKAVLIASDTLDDGTKGVFVDKKGHVTAADAEGAQKVSEGDRNTYLTSMTKDGEFGAKAPDIIVTLKKEDLARIDHIESMRAAADNNAQRVTITYKDGHTATLIGGNVKLAMEGKDAKDVAAFAEPKLKAVSNENPNEALEALRKEQGVSTAAAEVSSSPSRPTGPAQAGEKIVGFIAEQGQSQGQAFVIQQQDGQFRTDRAVADGLKDLIRTDGGQNQAVKITGGQDVTAAPAAAQTPSGGAQGAGMGGR